MRDQSSIHLEIPVPWAKRPCRISARGLFAVLMATVAAVAIVVIIHCL